MLFSKLAGPLKSKKVLKGVVEGVGRVDGGLHVRVVVVTVVLGVVEGVVSRVAVEVISFLHRLGAGVGLTVGYMPIDKINK